MKKSIKVIWDENLVKEDCYAMCQFCNCEHYTIRLNPVLLTEWKGKFLALLHEVIHIFIYLCPNENLENKLDGLLDKQNFV